jgi:CPA2 family monovalent cation:H+ antiporter-2
LKTGDLWNQLRLCLTCGYVGCCDDSRNQHATKHFHQTQHPLIRSLEPGEHWVWCYPDKLYFEKVPGLSRRTPWSLLTGWLRR